MNKWYDWRDNENGRVTIQWVKNPDMCGLLRVHDDPEKIPGDYNTVGTILVSNGKYEITGFLAKGERPSGQEFRSFYGHLEKDLRLDRLRHVRAKNGKILVID